MITSVQKWPVHTLGDASISYSKGEAQASTAPSRSPKSYAYSSAQDASLGGASIQASPRSPPILILGACVGSWPRDAKPGPERPPCAPRDINAACQGLSSAWTRRDEAVRSHSPNTHRPVSFPARGPASPKRKGLSRFRQSASGSAAFSSSSSPPYYGSLRRQRGILATAAAATGPTPPLRAGTSGGCLAGS